MENVKNIMNGVVGSNGSYSEECVGGWKPLLEAFSGSSSVIYSLAVTNRAYSYDVLRTLRTRNL